MTMSGWVALAATLIAGAGDTAPRQISGIYPHLATFNDELECGTGAVVPFADQLWIISYGPHLPGAALMAGPGLASAAPAPTG